MLPGHGYDTRCIFDAVVSIFSGPMHPADAKGPFWSVYVGF
jgi:hypothetical protein